MKTGISYNTGFEQMEACVAAGLDLYKWDMGEYPPRLQARVIAWWRGRGLIEANKNDAVAKDMKKRGRKKK